jgi:response regulator NasT
MDLIEMLQEAGYTICAEATNGEEAIALATEHKPDLCILDVKMPVLDGISAAEKIISIAPVLMLTAFSQRELVERARDAGVFAYLVKPFKELDLMPAIEIAIARFEEFEELDREVNDLENKLDARKTVDRAKGILMDQYGLKEQDAFRRIQVQSMNTRKTMREIADAIILANSV